jgi:hypothetical protein
MPGARRLRAPTRGRRAIARIWTRDPRQILYRDPYQVVAKPERTMLD